MTANVTHRCDVIGSMLRPPSLKRARSDFEEGAISPVELKRVEDRAVDGAVASQEAAGLSVVTDGEMRRALYFDAIWGDFEGIAPIDTASRSAVFHGGDALEELAIPVGVVERLRRRGTAAVEEYTYARSVARVPVKVTMPNPLAFAYLWNSESSRAAYPDVQSLFGHASELLRDAIVEVASLGCQYVQIDFPELTMLVDERSRATHWDPLGLSPKWLMTEGIGIVDALVADIPDVEFGLHFCRGNHASKWMSQGGYGAMAEVFGRVPRYNRLLLEYDTERAGGFEPLREVPTDKTVVLGLVSTKSADLEDVEHLLSRIDAASEFFPREQLAISTQCGFASSIQGNLLDQGDENAKLRLVVEVAERAWG